MSGAGAVPLILQKDKLALEVAHRKALRWMLGVSHSAVSCAVSAEFGFTTAEAMRDRCTLTFFGTLTRKPDDSIARVMFELAWSTRGSVTASKWIKHVSGLLDRYRLDPQFAATKSDWSRRVKAAISRVSWQQWRDACGMHACSALRLTTLPVQPAVDPFMDTLRPAVRQLVVALRCGDAGLMRERLRIRRSATNICVMCTAGACEDLQPLLLACPAYDGARRSLMQSLPAEARRVWDRMTDKGRMQALLFLPAGAPIPTVIAAAVTTFLSRVWSTRAAHLLPWSRLV